MRMRSAQHSLSTAAALFDASPLVGAPSLERRVSLRLRVCTRLISMPSRLILSHASSAPGVALHGPGYSGETPLVNKAFFPEGEGSDGWHVYSVDWTDDALLFRLDGRLIYRATRPMVEHYGRWAFDNPKYLILNLALGGAYPVKTNGVTEPYPGMPQSTVDLIRADRGEVLVDWVLVTATP